MKHPNESIRAAIREAAKSPKGFRIGDFPAELGREKVRNHAEDFVKSGLLHRVSVSHKVIRYFGDVRDAMAFERTVRKVAFPPAAKKAAARWLPDAPIHYPTNPDGSPAYRITIAPSPAQPTRTATHSSWGG